MKKRIIALFATLTLCLSIFPVSGFAIDLPDPSILESVVAAIESSTPAEPDEMDSNAANTEDTIVSVQPLKPENSASITVGTPEDSLFVPQEGISVVPSLISAPVLYATSYSTSDLIQLMKYIIGAKSSMTLTKADVNGDGKADILDVIRMMSLCTNPSIDVPAGYSGWFEADDGSLYYFENGYMYRDEWIMAQQYVYYFYPSGKLATGWFQARLYEDSELEWFYADYDSSSVSGWMKDGGNWYYICGLGEGIGRCLSDGVFIIYDDGKYERHRFDETGIWLGEADRMPSLVNVSESTVLAAFRTFMAEKSSDWHFAVLDLDSDGLPELLAGDTKMMGSGPILEDAYIYYYDGDSRSVEDSYCSIFVSDMFPEIYWTNKGFCKTHYYARGGGGFTYTSWCYGYSTYDDLLSIDGEYWINDDPVSFTTFKNAMNKFGTSETVIEFHPNTSANRNTYLR